MSVAGSAAAAFVPSTDTSANAVRRYLQQSRDRPAGQALPSWQPAAAAASPACRACCGAGLQGMLPRPGCCAPAAGQACRGDGVGGLALVNGHLVGIDGAIHGLRAAVTKVAGQLVGIGHLASHRGGIPLQRNASVASGGVWDDRAGHSQAAGPPAGCARGRGAVWEGGESKDARGRAMHKTSFCQPGARQPDGVLCLPMVTSCVCALPSSVARVDGEAYSTCASAATQYLPATRWGGVGRGGVVGWGGVGTAHWFLASEQCWQPGASAARAAHAGVAEGTACAVPAPPCTPERRTLVVNVWEEAEAAALPSAAFSLPHSFLTWS